MHIACTVELPPDLQDWAYTAASTADAHHAFVHRLVEIEDDLVQQLGQARRRGVDLLMPKPRVLGYTPCMMTFVGT